MQVSRSRPARACSTAPTHPVSEETRQRVLNAAKELGYAAERAGPRARDPQQPDHRRDRRRHRRPLLRRDRARRRGGRRRRWATSRWSAAPSRARRPRSATCASCASTTRPGSCSPAAAGSAIRTRRSSPTPSTRRASAGAVVVALAQRDFEAPSIVFDNEAAVYDITTYVRSLGPPGGRVRRGPAEPAHERAAARRLQPRGRRRRVPGGFSYEDGVAAAERLLARGEPPGRDRGRQRRGGDRRADALARGRRQGARAGVGRRDRRHASGALRRA